MKYRPLMILGSGSDVGKSIVVAALCRIFRQESIRVAPFKAQNMALNSFITVEGHEMGRAQVVQAQAAGIPPHVDMNPILLKPSSDMGCQVILEGRVYGDLNATDYHARRRFFVRKTMAAYRRLSERHDLIVLEGAGGAAELNLKRRDIVNFSMARRAGANVVLVADIDRGGVFSSTIGTFLLLTPSERRMLKGFIINKFRGDPSLFHSGTAIIESRTKRPVFGVLPFLDAMAIPQEDSVALDTKCARSSWSGGNRIRIGVLRLPHISNYTDFDPLEQEPWAEVRYLRDTDVMDDVDLLILPGTKNTIADLTHLKKSGGLDRIRAYARAGGRVIGICGGYQMLGETVRDPFGVEGPPREEPGLGLLPVVTTMAPLKTTTQVAARETGVQGLNPDVEGYEIHMGETRPHGPGRPAFTITLRNGEAVCVADGWVEENGRVWGSYLHGLFDNDRFRRSLFAPLLKEKGISAQSDCGPAYTDFLEEQFDRLADVFRRHVDVEAIRRLITL